MKKQSEWKQAAKLALKKSAGMQPPPQQAGQQGQGDPGQQGGGGNPMDQQTSSTDEMEKAFFDQAYQAIQNNLMPLVQAGLQIGFEIVFKTPQGDRMCGIFIFRTGTPKSLLYAPVFFLKGSIKDVSLLYRTDTRTFCPANPDWANYFITNSSHKEGEPVDPQVRMLANNHADLISLIQPPRWRKIASSKPKNLFEQDMDEMFSKVASLFQSPAYTPDNILKRFITEDGGYSSIATLHKAAKTSYDFANALFMSCDEDVYAPDLQAMDKSASASNVEPALAIYTDLLNNPFIKEASAEELARNYRVVDTRKEADLNSITYEVSPSEFEGISEPGIYNVLMADGSKHKCFVAYDGHQMLDGDTGSLMPECRTNKSRPSLPGHIHNELCLVDLDTRESKMIGRSHEIFGTHISPIQDKESELKDTMESGKSYRVFSTHGKSLSKPLHVKSVSKTDAGLTKYTCNSQATTPNDNAVDYIVNPDYEGVVDCDKVLGKFYKFIEIARETTSWGSHEAKSDNLKIGEQSAMDKWIFSEGYKKASVLRLPSSADYVVQRQVGERRSPVFTKLGAKLALMNECDLTEEAADEVVDLAGQRGSHQFFYKSAQQLQWRQFPEFYQQFSSDFNVPEEDQDYMKYQVLAQGNRPMQLRHRVGDGIKLNNPNQDAEGGSVAGIPGDENQSKTNDTVSEAGLDMDTATPLQLYQLSQQKGIGNLFEHGVVGALTKTYDSVAMVDKYLPDLEKALDRLGRILFLLWWKPTDFSDAYGSDDQSELENKLTSNFKALGELVLELLMKSKSKQPGTPALT
jgi:hypothetical protein